jgi:endoribonuclease Dicer
MSFRDQVNALRKFRRGETNCLFATTVAEEGIDIPDCDLVIRFDLYKSVIQYIQSKGRARQKHSRYISMLEEGNLMDLRRLKQASRDASALRQFCSILPADRKVQDDDDGHTGAASRAQAELLNQRVLEIPSTKARLTPLSSIGVLFKFVSSLPAEDNQFQKPEYIMTHLGTLFRAEVILPDTSPVKAVSGYPQRSKQLARGSAAFEACQELIQQKHINDHLQPTFVKRLPAMRNARLAVSENKKAEYNMRIKPNMWSRISAEDGSPCRLYATAIILEDCPRASCPLAILSRDSLPALPTIPLFFSKHKASKAHLLQSETCILVSEAQVHTLTAYTLKIFSDIFSKDFDVSQAQLPYFIAAVLLMETSPSKFTPGIQWTSMENALKTPYLDWQGKPEAFFHDKFVVDPYDGGRKMVLRGINNQLRPSDPTPIGVPKHRTHSYRFVPPIIKEYSNSLWLKARLRAKWRDDQPVVNADMLSLRRNLLDDRFIDAEVESRIYIILEPLMVSSVCSPSLVDLPVF